MSKIFKIISSVIIGLLLTTNIYFVWLSYTFMQDVKELTRQNYLLDKEITDLKSEAKELEKDNADVVPTPEANKISEESIRTINTHTLAKVNYEMEYGRLYWDSKLKNLIDNNQIKDVSRKQDLLSIQTIKGNILSPVYTQYGQVINSNGDSLYVYGVEYPKDYKDHADIPTIYKVNLKTGNSQVILSDFIGTNNGEFEKHYEALDNDLFKISGSILAVREYADKYLLFLTHSCFQCGLDGSQSLYVLNLSTSEYIGLIDEFITGDINNPPTFDLDLLKFNLENNYVSYPSLVDGEILHDEMYGDYISQSYIGEEVRIKLP